MQDAFGAEARGVVQSAQGPEPRMGDHDVRSGLFVQRPPVAFVLRGDGDEARVVLCSPFAQYEHHLPGVAGEFLLGRAHDPFGLRLVVHRAVEHHHARELERVVEPRDIPAVGLVGDGRHAEPGDVGRYAVVLEHRFVVLVVDDRAERAVVLPFEKRVEGQRAGVRSRETGPVVVEQDVP